MAYMGGTALSASPTNTRVLAGQLIAGKYRVTHILGEGGMASVWAGSNESTGKLVALKVIRASFMATPGADKFLRSEGLVASRINHPNVVTVFDVVEHDGMPCIVMELLDGLPFGTYIKRHGPLSLRDAISLLLPAMRGVAAAHAQGVVHRDLKPQNIFVCIGPDARIVTTKVLDFGISLMVDWARGSSVAPVPGLVGTPSYMSPEHIEGSTVLDPRTDVYGFGLLFYEALSGHMAFPGEPGPELLKQVLGDTPTPLHELCPDLPPAVVTAIESAMAKRPEQRFAGLNEMVHVLEEQLALLAPPPMGTPANGVPVSGMSYAVSSSIAIAIPTFVGKENSEPIQKTQIFGQPSRPDIALDSLRPDGAEGSGRLALPPRQVVDVGVPTEVVSLKARWLLTRLRDRRVQVGGGVGLLALLIVIWAAAGGPSAPPTVPVSIPRASAPAPVVTPVPPPVLAPATPPVVVPLPGPAETPPEPQEEAPSVAPPPASPVRPAVARAARSAGAKAKTGSAPGRGAKTGTLRAGSLSEDDF